MNKVKSWLFQRIFYHLQFMNLAFVSPPSKKNCVNYPQYYGIVSVVSGRMIPEDLGFA